MSVRIIQGDVRDVLPTLDADSFDCIVTSPPYYGLRDYGCLAQIGLEHSLCAYLETIVSVCRELRRVLKPSGVFFLNIGDSYATLHGGAGHQGKSGQRASRSFTVVGSSKKGVPAGLKPKDLMLIPERLGIALQTDGWWVRSKIVWHKPNPMPEPVTDRPTSAHETIWMLTKSERYLWNAEAVKEETNGRELFGNSRRKGNCEERKDNERRDMTPTYSRNVRNVWTIASQPFAGPHFATMPMDLAERCIKAGSPSRGMILDPFAGSGTTGLVADRLGRDCTLIDLNIDYARMALHRIKDDAPLLTEVFDLTAAIAGR